MSLLYTPVLSQEPPVAKSPVAVPAPRGATPLPVQLRDLLELSQKSKLGLAFIVGGQSIAGTVIQIYGDEAVEIRNPTHKRFLIRLDRIDALGITN